MAICPKCGSWVDEGDICRNCTGSASHESGQGNGNPPEKADRHRANMLGREAWKLYMDYNDEDALVFINRALEYDRAHSNNWNRKAIILEDLKRFDESKECYDRSLSLKKSNIVTDNKARMIKEWATRLSERGIGLKIAERILKEAISEISSIPTEEDVSEYEKLLKSIQSRLDY